MTAWWEQGFVVLDTETDSTNPEQAHLASICRAVINPAVKSKDVRTSYVAIEMPDEASKVNGLKTEFLMAEGKPPADVLDEYCADLSAALSLGTPVVIMNAPYDLAVLDRDCRRNGVPTITDRLDGRPIAPILDPGVLDKQVVQRRRRVSPTQGARCLKTLAQVHGVGWDDELAHTAEYDALQAGRVVWQLMRRYPQLAAMSLDELHRAQVGWYSEQSKGLQGWFFGEGNRLESEAERAADDAVRETLLADAEVFRVKAESVTYDWPLRPFGGAA